MTRKYPVTLLPAIVASFFVLVLMVVVRYPSAAIVRLKIECCYVQVTLSTPVWNNVCSEMLHALLLLTFCFLQVYFLKLNLKSDFVTFGVLGSTGSSQQLGWIPSQWGGNGTTCVFAWTTRASCA